MENLRADSVSGAVVISIQISQKSAVLLLLSSALSTKHHEVEVSLRCGCIVDNLLTTTQSVSITVFFQAVHLRFVLN